MLDEHLESAGMLANVFPAVEALGDAICEALGNGNQIITFGNGGSAAEAGHLAAELLGRAGREREPLAAIALNADAATVTAIANDYCYAEVFARQVRGLANAGDIVLGISTSGRSEHALRALRPGPDAGAALPRPRAVPASSNSWPARGSRARARAATTSAATSPP